jgi:hypothetical protein
VKCPGKHADIPKRPALRSDPQRPEMVVQRIVILKNRDESIPNIKTRTVVMKNIKEYTING